MHQTFSVQGKMVTQGPGLIDRPRLLQRLQGAFSHKLTLITAPPGFGKTSLLVQLARVAQVPVVWQLIDERSRDVPNLYGQAISSLAAIAPGIVQLARPYGYGPGELAALIANHLSENLNGEFVYILDDVHLLTGAVAAESWLRSLVSVIPATCHLILASRALPRLPLVEMIARSEVLAIGLDELRFTAEEIAELGTRLLGDRPSDDQVKQLAERLEGWPAGLVLAFQPLPPDLEQAALSGQGGPEALFDSLARMTLQAQPEDIRDFLLASSTLTRLTPQMCEEVLDLRNSSAKFAEIQRRNLFVSRVSGALIYHALFRNFLQAELHVLDSELFVALHARAARWFEANDQPEESFDHYIAADEPILAATLAEHLASAYFAQGRVETLLAWNTELRRMGTPAPRLAFACAVIYTDRYDYDNAEERLHETEATRLPDQSDVSLASLHIQYGQINVQRGNCQEAIDHVASLADAELEPTNIRGRALNILGRTALQMGYTEEAIHRYEAALPLYRAYADTYSQSQFLHNLAAAYWRAGRLTDALAVFQEVVALQRSLGGAGPLAMALNALGYSFHHLGDYKHAVAALQEGLSAISRFPNRRAESYLLFNLADVRRDQGEMEEAFKLYNQALEAVSDKEPSLACTVLSGLSTLHRWQGKLTDAVSVAQSAENLAAKHTIGMEGREARLALWAAQVETDSYTAFQQLDQVAQEMEQQQERFALLQALALCAVATTYAGQAESAEEYLDKAFQLGKTIGTIVPLAIEILHQPSLEHLLSQRARKYSTLLNTIEQIRALQIPATHNVVPDEQIVPMIYSLRIMTLGQAVVIRDGHSIPTSEWRPAARDLFLYLVFVNGANRDQICHKFWPDSSEKRARDTFHTTMYRIREVLGETTVILQEDGMYQLNPEINVWCDARELESIAAQARVLSISDARTEDLWRRAVGLYNGDFLPSLEFDWATNYRELLHDTYVESLVGLGRCVQRRGDYRETIDIYKRALEAEPYREDIHQALMACYVAKGAKHKAMAHLNQLRKLLRNDLGIGPSQETLQLAKTLFA